MRSQIALYLFGILFFTTVLACAGGKKHKSVAQQGFNSSHLTKYQSMQEFDPAWREIDSLLRKGLPKSALEKLNEIEQDVRSSKHPGQLVKWVKTKVVVVQDIEENSDWKNYQRFQDEIAKADTPAKQVLQFYLAEYLHQWTQNNQWRIKQRSAVMDSKEDDLRTWSLQKLENETNTLYNASVAEKSLKALAVSAIAPNVIKGKGTDGLRPSLFDLLAHGVLQYYTQENNFLTEPAYQFYIDNPDFFAQASTFANIKIQSKDESSRKLAALRLFQELTKAHLSSSNPDALLDVELLRLTFVYQNYVGENTDDLYLDALNRLRKKYADSPLAAEVISDIANVYIGEGRQFNPKDPTKKGKDSNRKAVELLKEGIRLYPDTYGADLCNQSLSDVTQRDIRVRAEEVYLPMEPGLIKLEYKNIKQVKLKIYKLDNPYDLFFSVLNYNQNSPMGNQKAVVQKEYKLKSENDYHEHSTELMMPALPFGQYGLEVIDNEDHVGTFIAFQVSNLAVFRQKEQKEDGDYFRVLNRKQGEVVVGAKVMSFKSKNYNEIIYKNPTISVTDVKGIAKIKPFQEKPNNSYFVAVSKGYDLLVLGNRYYQGRYYSDSRDSYMDTHFFLDRAIYRPGQTVYFKALVLENDPDRIPHIQKNKAVSLTVYDANGQKYKTFKLVTNDYGTVNGQFKLPTNGLNGRFSITSDANGSHGFRVEDYKRPKFEVKMSPPEKAYSVGDLVTIKGEAKNYSAAALDGAKVRFVVNRQVNYPYWRSFWSYWYSPAAPTQVAMGETTTKPDGSFEVQFEALPDRTVDKSTKPTFTYSIEATVTDITGEVHETSSSVTVGYVALLVDMNLKEKMKAADFKNIKISSVNLNGQFAQAKGNIKLERLKIPSTYYLKRYWKKPEYQLLSKEQFHKYFPHFAYGDEDDRAHWPVGNVVFEQKFDTQVSDSVIVNSGIVQGVYKVTLTAKDKNGELVEVIKFIELEDDGDGYVLNKLFDLRLIKTNVQPGELAKISLASRAKVNYLVNTYRYRKTGVENIETIKHETKTLDFPVAEQDRGGFLVMILAVHSNRFYEASIGMSVPWSNKDLKITYESFREKLYPGQKEKWKIKIAGPKADAAAAEVVATLYDASLDVFVRNYWATNFYPTRYFRAGWSSVGDFDSRSDGNTYYDTYFPFTHEKSYDRIEQMNLHAYGRWHLSREMGMDMKRKKTMDAEAPMPMMVEEEAVVANDADGMEPPSTMKPPTPPSTEEKDASDKTPIVPRTNLKETVFFKPDLKTDADGNVIIEFTMNEALTKWKLMTFAHDKELRFAFSEKEVITQKELMVIPNPPRFLREFDEIEFSAKVVNLSEKDLRPNVELQLLDELHTMPVYKWLDNPQFNKVIDVPKGRSTAVSFRFKVPSAGKIPLIKWTLIAADNEFSDGESSYLPVMTNRMLVTETMPLPVKAKQKKTFVFEAMEKTAQSQSLENHSFTLEFTANPAWYAVQALPYIMEYPHECSEQVFSRLYANTLATSIANSHPKIKKVFEKWRTTDTEALASNLSKNQELKSAVLEETPWVMNALSEEEQKKNIGLLFDLDRMAGEQDRAIRTLAERQSNNGGFAWFPGGQESWYITQHIVEGFGHLRKLNAMNENDHPAAWKISRKAVKYIDNELLKHYQELEDRVKRGLAKWEDDHLGDMVIHYLYARSFFLNEDLPNHLRKPYDYYLGQAKKYYLGKGLYQEGLIALALQRNNEKETARNIMNSLKERSITNDELGMYWKQNYGYFWYQLPVETNALMIEAFDEIMNDAESVYQLKIWLLKNKQTTHWKTTKATAAAVYALLMSGENWLLEDQPISIKLGNTEVKPEKTQAGTGYFKQSWDKESMPSTSDMSHITVENPNAAIAWGAVYWQYFEDLDKVKIFKDTPLKLKKELFREKQTDRGVVLEKIGEGEPIHVGDKLKMRIELRVDRAMEYVHMKDMRAAGLEPSNVLSQYKWQDGLGYYESTRDLATDFFFSYLRPGVYVFEYPLTAQLKGNFSNGVTTIQCMYAPEFSSHSEGVRVTID